MTGTHRIIVENVKNDELLPHVLILIRGRIQCSLVNNCSCRNGTLALNSDSKWAVLNSQFVCLSRLSRGQNAFTLCYCGTTHVITVVYEPPESARYVRLLYIVCGSDPNSGQFQAPPEEDNSIASAHQRITLAAELAQLIYAEKLAEKGLKRKTFQFEPMCTTFQLSLTVEESYELSSNELWLQVARELSRSEFWHCNYKYLAFLSCTRYVNDKGVKPKTFEEIVAMTKGYCALGGEGLALLGSGCMYTWPSKLEDVVPRLSNKKRINWKMLMDDSGYRGTYGATFARSLGSLLHELGHTFDLGHTKDGIMGHEFGSTDSVFLIQNSTEYSKNKIFWSESCASMLYHHQWFNRIQPIDVAAMEK